MGLRNLDKIHEAREIADGIRDNLIFMEGSNTSQIPHTICVVLETALDKVLLLLDEVAADMEGGNRDSIRGKGQNFILSFVMGI